MKEKIINKNEYFFRYQVGDIVKLKNMKSMVITDQQGTFVRIKDTSKEKNQKTRSILFFHNRSDVTGNNEPYHSGNRCLYEARCPCESADQNGFYRRKPEIDDDAAFLPIHDKRKV